MIILRYHTNNSGGSYWLGEDDWQALADNGWNVHWIQEDGIIGSNDEWSEITHGDLPLKTVERKGKDFLGAPATSAAGKFESVEEGIDSFERLTSQDSCSLGCNCCGPPHSFEWCEDNGKYDWNYIYLEEPATGELSW